MLTDTFISLVKKPEFSERSESFGKIISRSSVSFVNNASCDSVQSANDKFALPWHTTQLYQCHAIETTLLHFCYRFFSYIKLNNPFVQIPI